jgi:hypothetical protein
MTTQDLLGFSRVLRSIEDLSDTGDVRWYRQSDDWYYQNILKCRWYRLSFGRILTVIYQVQKNRLEMAEKMLLKKTLMSISQDELRVIVNMRSNPEICHFVGLQAAAERQQSRIDNFKVEFDEFVSELYAELEYLKKLTELVKTAHKMHQTLKLFEKAEFLDRWRVSPPVGGNMVTLQSTKLRTITKKTYAIAASAVEGCRITKETSETSPMDLGVKF